MFRYEELKQMTSEKFAEQVKRFIDRQLEIRKIKRIDIKVLDDNVVVEYMASWAGESHSLWSHWYDLNSGEFGYDVINHNHVERFLNWNK